MVICALHLESGEVREIDTGTDEWLGIIPHTLSFPIFVIGPDSTLWQVPAITGNSEDLEKVLEQAPES